MDLEKRVVIVVVYVLLIIESVIQIYADAQLRVLYYIHMIFSRKSLTIRVIKNAVSLFLECNTNHSVSETDMGRSLCKNVAIQRRQAKVSLCYSIQ
jgi:hypothetical protein